jgi:threonine/homoserine/homoserine lactone efflux protein
MPTHHLLAFCVTALALIAVPGPSVLFVISRSLTFGRLAGFATVVGNTAGVYVQVIAVAVGIGAIVERSIVVFTTIKLVGAAYLLYLGVQAFRHRHQLVEAFDTPPAPRRIHHLIRDAFIVGIANPKAIVFFAAILPQFVDRSAGHVQLQMLMLGAVFCLIALISDGTWALLAGSARPWLTRKPRRLEMIGGAGGLAMIGIGVKLAFSGRSD